MFPEKKIILSLLLLYKIVALPHNRSFLCHICEFSEVSLGLLVSYTFQHQVTLIGMESSNISPESRDHGECGLDQREWDSAGSDEDASLRDSLQASTHEVT